MIERAVNPEHIQYWQRVRELEQVAIKLWQADVYTQYQLPTAVLDVIMSRAYDRNHSSGNDAVAAAMNDEVDYYSQLKAAGG